MWHFYVSGQKIKDELSKFMDKMKPKRPKKKKKIKTQDGMFRMMVTQADVSNEDYVSSREGSIHSQQDSDRVRLLQITQYVKVKTTVSETWQIHCCFLAKFH